MIHQHRRRKQRARSPSSSAFFILWTALSSAKALAYTDETNDGIMTYSEYKRQNAVVDAIKTKKQSSNNDPAGNFLDSCDGYPSPFTEVAFITLYGPGAEEPFTPSDGAIFLDILQETLNECTDPCIYIDEVDIAEDELQKIGVLNLDFDGVGGGGGGGTAVQGLSSTRNGRGGRDLEEQHEEDGREASAVAEMEIDAGTTAGGDNHADRQLQRRQRTKKRRIKKAVMRGRKKRRKSKDGRSLQQSSGADSLVEATIPKDNSCGTILMRKLAATGNPAFTCLFSRGAFISSCDPRDIPLLLEEEELLDRNRRNRNANTRELAEDGASAMPITDSIRQWRLWR